MGVDTQLADDAIVITPADRNCVTCEPIEIKLDASSVDVQAFNEGECAYSETQPVGEAVPISDWAKYFLSIRS